MLTSKKGRSGRSKWLAVDAWILGLCLMGLTPLVSCSSAAESKQSLVAIGPPRGHLLHRLRLVPFHAQSRSGEFSLHVTPSHSSGEGPATYTLRQGETLVWSGERDLCLREARVLDDGRVVGYAYKGGVHLGSHGLRRSGLTVVMLDAAGVVELCDPASSHESGLIDARTSRSGSDSPEVLGVIVDVENDRFSVRTYAHDTSLESAWWTYHLGTGDKLDDLIPTPADHGTQGFSREVSAHPLPGTPLTLVQWYVYREQWPRERRSWGATLGLLDEKGKTVWTRSMPENYEMPDGLWDWWDVRAANPPQVQVRNKAFSFRPLRETVGLEFTVAIDDEFPSGWRIEML